MSCKSERAAEIAIEIDDLMLLSRLYGLAHLAEMLDKARQEASRFGSDDPRSPRRPLNKQVA